MRTMTLFPTERPPRSDESSRFQITPRVFAILAAVGRFGILTSDQIARLDGGSRQKITRILQKCVDHQLLVRPQPTEPLLTEFFDNRPRPYALTAKGARILAHAPHPIAVTPSKARVLLQHGIDVAESIAFGFDAAVAAEGKLRLIDQPQLRALLPSTTRSLKKPFCLRPEVRPADFPHLAHLLKKPMTLPVEPDRVFVILAPNNTGRTFAFELDRGTEDITATTLKGRATYYRKQLSYYAAWSQGLHVAQWGEGFKSLRVLTATTSEGRILNMLETQRTVLGGNRLSGLFLYTTIARMKEHGALSPIWISSEGDGNSLLERT